MGNKKLRIPKLNFQYISKLWKFWVTSSSSLFKTLKLRFEKFFEDDQNFNLKLNNERLPIIKLENLISGMNLFSNKIKKRI